MEGSCIEIKCFIMELQLCLRVLLDPFNVVKVIWTYIKKQKTSSVSDQRAWVPLLLLQHFSYCSE